MFGLERGYCLMIGGDDRRRRPAWRRSSTRSPPASTAPTRTPGRSGDPTPAERGWLHCGPSGAGHFVKMVHNGIEYGLMAAYAEGLNVLAKANIGADDHPKDAETAPLDRPASTTSTTSTWRRSPRCGDAAAWSPAGCSTSPPPRSPPTRSSTRTRGVRQRLRRGPLDDPAPRSTRACRCRCCRPRCTTGSPRGAGPTSPTRSSRPCVPVSAATSNERNPLDELRPHRQRADRHQPAHGRRPGAVRRHRRPRQAQAVPRALPTSSGTAS